MVDDGKYLDVLLHKCTTIQELAKKVECDSAILCHLQWKKLYRISLNEINRCIFRFNLIIITEPIEIIRICEAEWLAHKRPKSPE